MYDKQEALEDLIKLFQSDEVQLRRYMERSEWIRNEVDRLIEENKKLRRVNSELKSANELLQETLDKIYNRLDLIIMGLEDTGD